MSRIHDVTDLRSAPELYLTRRQLADRLGLGLSTVDKFVRLGMPSMTWGIRTRRFQLSAVERWLRERERMAA
jgi:excisionase family DNA binding protein